MKKVIALLGNGEKEIFKIAHPASPHVVVSAYETDTGEYIYPEVTALKSEVVCRFGFIPEHDQITVVVIG